MWNRHKSLLLASVALVALPAAAAAQEGDGFLLEAQPEKKPVKITTTTVEVGAGFVSEDSFKFGEYNGLGDSGSFFIGTIESYLRPPYDNEEDDTRYFELRGTDLGLDSRSLYMETGKQGDFGVFFQYDAIPHLRFNDGETPFIGVGGTELALPPDWVQGANTADVGLAGALNSSLRGLDVKTERERIGAGFKLNLTPQWDLSTSFRTEEKTGVDTIAGIFGTNGGNMVSSILPKPIDYSTHDAALTLAYSGDRLQAQFGYTLSVFDNDKDSLTWENPYSVFQPVTTDGEGRLALEPDNSAHHFTFAAGYMLSEQMRLTGSLSLGRMIQDDEFLPYTVRPDLAAGSVPLPRNSLDGEVNTIHATLGVATNLSENTDLRAEYKFDDRDNNTPVDAYLRIPNDSDVQVSAGTDDERFNRPYSKRSHKVETELGYDVTSDTKLSVGYDFEAINRDLQEVENTYEHTGRIKARSHLTESATGRLEYAFSSRTGSAYDTTRPYAVSHNPPAIFEQNAFLRKYYMADRRQHVVKGGLTSIPSDRLTVGLNGSFSLSDYYNTQVGLTDSYYASGTLDGAYMPSQRTTITGFFTYEQIQYDQVGNEVGGTQVVGGGTLDPTRLWDETTQDNVMTAGAELAFSAIPDTLDLVLDYTYSRAVTEFDIKAGSSLVVSPLPDLESTLHSVGVRADYKARDDVTLRLGYRFQKFDVEDFALAGVDEIISDAVFGLGNVEPHYEVHLVGVSAVMKF